MLEVYAAWADGAVESDVLAIRNSMGLPMNEAPGGRSGLLRLVQNLFRKSYETRAAEPGISVWHWIWHQERGACT